MPVLEMILAYLPDLDVNCYRRKPVFFRLVLKVDGTVV